MTNTSLSELAMPYDVPDASLIVLKIVSVLFAQTRGEVRRARRLAGPVARRLGADLRRPARPAGHEAERQQEEKRDRGERPRMPAVLRRVWSARRAHSSSSRNRSIVRATPSERGVWRRGPSELLEQAGLERFREWKLLLHPRNRARGVGRRRLDRGDDLGHRRRLAGEVRDVRAVAGRPGGDARRPCPRRARSRTGPCRRRGSRTARRVRRQPWRAWGRRSCPGRVPARRRRTGGSRSTRRRRPARRREPSPRSRACTRRTASPVRCRRTPARARDRTRCRPPSSSRRRAREPVAARLQRLEDDDGPEDVDPRAECRVGAAERNLERRQVDHRRDVVLVERPAERVSVGDVSLDQRHALALVVRRGRCRSRESSLPRS